MNGVMQQNERTDCSKHGCRFYVGGLVEDDTCDRYAVMCSYSPMPGHEIEIYFIADGDDFCLPEECHLKEDADRRKP